MVQNPGNLSSCIELGQNLAISSAGGIPPPLPLTYAVEELSCAAASWALAAPLGPGLQPYTVPTELRWASRQAAKAATTILRSEGDTKILIYGKQF
jgi:hypothetical protein